MTVAPCTPGRRRPRWADAGRAARSPGLLGLLARRRAAVQPDGDRVPDRRRRSRSVAFQLPELGLLTLAMLIPILSGGLNLAITFTANIAALALAWVLQADGGRRGRDGRLPASAALAALAVGARHRLGHGGGDRLYRRASDPGLARHDDLPARARRVPDPRRRRLRLSAVRRPHRAWLGSPASRSRCSIFIACVALWHVLLSRTRLGFSIYMVGSNIEAARYSGIDTQRALDAGLYACRA